MRPVFYQKGGALIMAATALSPVYVAGLTTLPAATAADTTNGNSFPVGANLYIENGTGAQTLKFTPAKTGTFDFAEVTVNLAANTKYELNAAYFKNACPAGTVVVKASANTVLLRAVQFA